MPVPPPSGFAGGGEWFTCIILMSYPNSPFFHVFYSYFIFNLLFLAQECVLICSQQSPFASRVIQNALGVFFRNLGPYSVLEGLETNQRISRAQAHLLSLLSGQCSVSCHLILRSSPVTHKHFHGLGPPWTRTPWLLAVLCFIMELLGLPLPPKILLLLGSPPLLQPSPLSSLSPLKICSP